MKASRMGRYPVQRLHSTAQHGAERSSRAFHKTASCDSWHCHFVRIAGTNAPVHCCCCGLFSTHAGLRRHPKEALCLLSPAAAVPVCCWLHNPARNTPNTRKRLTTVSYQRLPAKHSSISSSVGEPRPAAVTLRSSEYMLITNPGVQKPHWLPWLLARAACTG